MANNSNIYDEYIDYDANSTCPDHYEFYSREITHHVWTHHVCGAFAYLIALFNVLVVSMFVKSRNITPTSIILMCLAVTDTLAAFCQSFPWQFGLILGLIKNAGTNVHVRAGYCEFFALVEAPLFYAFNDTSILLTTQLCIIKVMALQFPIWFRLNMTNKKAMITSTFLALFAFVLELHPVFTFRFEADESGLCCYNKDFSGYYYAYTVVGLWILPMIYLVASISLIFSSTFIAAKLFCCRNGIDLFQISEQARRRHRNVTISVIAITIVFLISETLDFVCILSPMMTTIFDLPDVYESDWFKTIFQYQRLILEIGYASNFVIYIITCEEFRRNIRKMLTCKGNDIVKKAPTKRSVNAY